MGVGERLIENYDIKLQQNNKQRMADLNNSHVEFFNSESSFGTDALSNSRILDLAEELIQESELIFFSLKEVLVPRQDILNENNFKQVLHRARILHNETIPENMAAIQRSSGLDDRIRQIKSSRLRLEDLLTHYDQFRNGEMSYEQFFNIYGREVVQNFTKKQPMEINIQPDVVQIIQAGSTKNLRGGAKPDFKTTSRDLIKQKEVQELKDEINILKRREKQLAKEREDNEARMKAEAAERVRRVLQFYKSSNENEKIDALKKEISINQEGLSKQLKANMELRRKVSALEQSIDRLNADNRMLKQEVESNRRLAMGNSRLSEQSDGGRSVFSEVDHGQGTNDVKKLHKMIKNLNYEKNLLRSELNKERESYYRAKKGDVQVLEQEVSHLKKLMEKKNIEVAEMNKEVDRYKVQNIKMRDRCQNLEKQLGLAKNSVQSLQKMAFAQSRVTQLDNSTRKQDDKSPGELHKINVTDYSGDGDEGYPYYNLLNKQFKIRFKRACLRDKQLLYKAKGLQVGVISENIKSNQIKMTLHLSNYCDQQPLYNLKLKANNSKGNKIAIQKVSFDKVEMGEQIKTPVYFTCKNYPFGSTVLICEYEYYGQREEVRILLPAHVFKQIEVRSPDGQFRESSTLKVPIERKIAKNLQGLKQYFKGANFDNNRLSASLWHRESETKVLVEVSEYQNCFIIRYEHRSGEELVTDYLMKTVSFLLRREK